MQLIFLWWKIVVGESFGERSISLIFISCLEIINDLSTAVDKYKWALNLVIYVQAVSEAIYDLNLKLFWRQVFAYF